MIISCAQLETGSVFETKRQFVMWSDESLDSLGMAGHIMY